MRRIYDYKGFLHLKFIGDLTIDNIMANIKLIFQGTKKSETDETDLECFLNNGNEISISIDCAQNNYPTLTSLDISTAIKFAKTLRSVINEAKEVNDGE